MSTRTNEDHRVAADHHTSRKPARMALTRSWKSAGDLAAWRPATLTAWRPAFKMTSVSEPLSRQAYEKG